MSAAHYRVWAATVFKASKRFFKLRSLLSVLIFGMAALSGCKSLPAEQKFSASQLREKAQTTMPRCVKEQCEFRRDGTLLGCRTIERFMGMIQDGESCEREYHSWREGIARWNIALERRYSLDAATAPTCIRQRTVPRRFIESLGVNPDSPNATAQALARTAFIPFSADCMAQVCKWRTQVAPGERSPYCLTPATKLVVKAKAESE